MIGIGKVHRCSYSSAWGRVLSWRGTFFLLLYFCSGRSCIRDRKFWSVGNCDFLSIPSEERIGHEELSPGGSMSGDDGGVMKTG